MRLFREPLLHFAVGGAILFAGYAWLNGERAETSTAEPVRIGEGEIRWLHETFTNQWLRSPSAKELQGLVADLVDEELLAREAEEMGLGEDDTIVRRRLAQKLQFLIEDTSRLVEPSEEELRRFHAGDPARFQAEARVSFAEIFFNPARRKDAASDANAALVALRSGGDRDAAAVTGDRLLLEAELRDADEQTVASMFGPDFARAVFALEPGVWSGPVKSGYGLHLVRVSEAVRARERPFEEVREEVLAEWRRERQVLANQQYLARLREKYGVALDESVKALLAAEPTADLAAK